MKCFLRNQHLRSQLRPLLPEALHVPITPVNTTLTVADAATLPYNSAITAAQMSGVSSQLNANIQSGTIPQILGNSVLAFMLGWGAQAANTSKTIFGQTYIFDGTNWNLTSPLGLRA